MFALLQVVKEYQIPEFDNLYLDMNGTSYGFQLVSLCFFVIPSFFIISSLADQTKNGTL